MPIPRPTSAIAIYRPPPPPPSAASSTSTSSVSSLSSPVSHFPRLFSPSNDNAAFPTSVNQTNPSSTGTTPPSSSAASLSPTPPAPWSYLNHHAANNSSLSYPSVPPPSLSSSPVVSTMTRSREASVSQQHIAPGRSRNPSRVGRGGSGTVERGARIAETGSLVRAGRSRAGSASNLPS